MEPIATESLSPFSPLAIANWFIRRANDEDRNVTPVQLQKLLYLAHGWHLAATGKPLVKGGFEAWQYGPVSPDMYRDLKHFESSPVRRLQKMPTPIESSSGYQTVVDMAPIVDDEVAEKVLDLVWKAYGKLSAGQLIDVTHEPNGAWAKAVGNIRPIPRGVVIPNQEIKGEFARRVAA